MQFITTDQRIATENFDVGMIYTVTFISGDNFTGACIGIGVDFVIFQRTLPELAYCLNMAAAADVASIEPLPEDIGQIIEYTGSVPVSIKTDGSALLDYLITGNMSQSGTPNPNNPIYPQECGELVTTGEHSGQYKLPVISGGTTTPVYLGDVQTTRNTVKRVFTGTETWYYSGTIFIWLATTTALTGAGLCSHFNYGSVSIDGNFRITTEQEYVAFQFRHNSITSLPDFKQWLADQYAAGTPVTVWYRRSSPLTTTLNEPLRKIGDYADTVSKAQTSVDIPTNNGSTTVDVETALKPSEVYIKYFRPLF